MRKESIKKTKHLFVLKNGSSYIDSFVALNNTNKIIKIFKNFNSAIMQNNRINSIKNLANLNINKFKKRFQ